MDDSYGARIKAARKRAGLKQTDVAAKMGCTSVNLSQWERNYRVPTIKNLERIAGAIGCHVSELFPSETLPNQADNPYWERICRLSERQRAKGMGKYGFGLEANPAAITARLAHLEEELIDALMYCEWIKDWISNNLARKDDIAERIKNSGTACQGYPGRGQAEQEQ